MFFDSQSEYNQEQYIKYLQLIGSLSNLFSESPTPYLYYRIAEKIFCRAFEAEDLSRGDVSVDAKKNGLGIGLKTFLAGNNKSLQKVAEFNKAKPLYEKLNEIDMIKKISELRNERIKFTKNAYGLENFIYHCVTREAKKFKVFEENMDLININDINNVKKKDSSISFNDGKNEYSFNLSKSTLNKRFITTNIIKEFDVEILEDPLEQLKDLLNLTEDLFVVNPRIQGTIYLPLYNPTTFIVSKKSGLNQRNGARKNSKTGTYTQRHPNELYIPIPINIHHKFPGFLPPREMQFALHLPDGKILRSKICQDDGKALMSDPNKDLGKRILRDVLALNEGTLVTYEMLQAIGIDSVRIDKINDGSYEINFAQTGSYEEFMQNNA